MADKEVKITKIKKEGKEREKVNNEINSGLYSGIKLETDNYWGETEAKDKKESDFSNYGLCATCKHFECAITQLSKTVFAKCVAYEVRLRSNDPVEECTNYTEKGRLTLREMKEIAYLIDVEDVEEIGFLNKEK